MSTDADAQAVLTACTAGDVSTLSTILTSHPSLLTHRDALGQTPLHHAAASGSLPCVRLLLSLGHPWNAVDDAGRSAGEEALDGAHMDVWEALVEEGVRTEMVLGMLGVASAGVDPEGDEGMGDEDEDAEDAMETEEGEGEAVGSSSSSSAAAAAATKKIPNASYLSNPLVFSDGKILDSAANGVMMGWESPLMARHAIAIAPTEGLDVLNVGFGLGLIDGFLQERKPRTHTIIEAHPDVYKKMLSDGWDKKPGVRIVFGRWQDVMDQLETYDGIFFDTFGEYYEDLKEFHDHLPNLLRSSPTSIYSYFNGLSGTNAFFHEVSCRVAEADLLDIGLTTTYEEIEMDGLGGSDQEWDGVRRRYFTLGRYRMPVCRLDL